MEIIGSHGDSVLFSSENNAVLVNKTTNSILSVGKTDQLTSRVIVGKKPKNISPALQELAEAALIELNIEVLSSGDRMYTIPKGVVSEAKRGLEWRKEHDRGGTKVGMNTARTLAKGGQIGIRKVRHIAKYFPRHEVDKKGKGYKPGEDGYPSAGRIAWALWGGDAAKRWATAIVEREDKKLSETSMLAGGFYSQKPEKVYLDNFSDESVKFAIRVRKDNFQIDRLYQVDSTGQVLVWDDGCWDDLGNIHHDFDTYDKSLDDPYDTCEKVHVPIDHKSAVVLAGLIDSKPFHSFSPRDINDDEYEMFFSAKDNMDWQGLQALVAATDKDGNYTSEERSEKAKKQFRDRKGRFGVEGTRVKISSDPNARGLMRSIDDKGIATVELDSGETVEVKVSETEEETAADRLPEPPATPVDLSGVLGQPKKTKKTFKARLPRKLDVLTPEELAGVLADYPEYVQNQREERKREEIEAKALRASAEDSQEDYEDPSESDIDPIYMAIVADDDPQAVMELIALVPANAKSTVPMVFKRTDKKWEADEGILADLNSPTPPPVVVLKDDILEDVMSQVDSAVAASAGSPLVAEKYWLSGNGSREIAWGTPGDWTRCVSTLSKYLGEFAPAYASLLKKKATGVWVGDLENSQEYGFTASGHNLTSNDVIKPEEKIIESALLSAKMADARERVLTAGGKIQVGEGSKFYIPLVIPEGIESGDKRIFEKGAITLRELPLPLLWQIKTGEGHNGSVVVGRIDRMERTDDGIGNAYGVFDDGNYGKEAERLVKGGFIRGVSADLDQFEADEETIPSASEDEEDAEKQGRIKITKARVMAVTLVPKPAFQECTIQIEEDDQEEDVIPDGVYAEDADPTEASSLVACGITAGVIPTTPPSSWFEDPKLKKATPLTVDDEGRVFGHIAAWHVDHIGMSFGTKPPRSRSKYSYFHTGVVRTEEGADVPVGQLTLAGGHAALELSAQEAVRHYDDTASAIADVHAGEDSYGIWVAGALRPGTTPEQIRSLRASAPSGDWRPIKGHLELVAVCQVNVPGFPIARSRVASGQVMALVAAGANTLAHMKSDPVAELKTRIDNLERRPLEMAANDARSRVLAAKAEELANKVKKTKKEVEKEKIRGLDGDTDEETGATFAKISKKVRERLASEGKAMPDGAYPIRNVSDLKNAIQAFGRAKESERTEVRKHIVKRARGLDREDLIPENWPEAPKKYKDEASLDEVPEQGLLANEEDSNPCWKGYEMVGMKEVDGKQVPNCVPIDASAEDESSIEEFKYFSPEKRKKLAEEGKALPDGSFPIENSRDLKNAIWAFGRSKPSKREEVKDHIEKRAKALGKEEMLPDIWKGEGSVFSDEDDDELMLSIKERLSIVKSVVAAGGLDRNRGNAERLRRYWTKGPGAVKIRWGTPGDWKRCVRYLAKHMGPRAKGYCQLRHKEATGVYTGSKLNPGRSNSAFSTQGEQEFTLSETLSDTFEVVETFVSEDDMRTPVEWILEESDELFDEFWEPDVEIVELCRMAGEALQGVNDDDYDSLFDVEEEFYDYDEYDSVFASKDPEIPEDLTPEEIQALKDEAKKQEDAKDSPKKMRVVRKEGKYTPETQPRDAQGRFRKVLARLKLDLGTAGLDRAIDKVEEIENLDFSGDYSRAAEASKDLIGIIDRLDKKALNPESLENVRASSEQLGKVIANLPFAFGRQEEKIRYSDVPPALRSLIEDMIDRVEKKIGKEDADIATAELRNFMSGGDYFSQSDISSQMAKLLRLLT